MIIKKLDHNCVRAYDRTELHTRLFPLSLSLSLSLSLFLSSPYNQVKEIFSLTLSNPM